MQSSGLKRGARDKLDKPDRLDYLDQLVIEFQTSQSKDAREQILANLANFAYDPLNYDYFRRLNVLDLFLDNLSNPQENLVKFSVGGLCNLCLDPINKKYIFENGFAQLVNLLSHSNEDIMLSVITILMFLITPNSKQDITDKGIVKCMITLSRCENKRISNLATIFLEDHCSEEQIKLANSTFDTDCNISDIPLPDTV